MKTATAPAAADIVLTAADLTRDHYDALTRRMMAPVFADLTSGSALCSVARFFEQHYAGAYSADKVVAVLNAYYDVDWNDSIRAALTKLVRMKALRTRRSTGKTLYEVNY
jgi:hypothetical protein